MKIDMYIQPVAHTPILGNLESGDNFVIPGRTDVWLRGSQEQHAGGVTTMRLRDGYSMEMVAFTRVIPVAVEAHIVYQEV